MMHIEPRSERLTILPLTVTINIAEIRHPRPKARLPSAGACRRMLKKNAPWQGGGARCEREMQSDCMQGGDGDALGVKVAIRWS